jgi:hypothetical protein
MRWTVTLVAELEPGQRIEHAITSVDRDDRITPATLGLSLAEGKTLLAAIQARLVVDQVTRHGTVARECRWCGHAQSSKGHYRSTFRSVFGNIPIRVRRFHACRCRSDAPATVPALFTRRSPIAPELLYLTAKLAALMPFGKVADFMGEVLPLSTKVHASTVRNRTLRVGKRLRRARAAPARPPTTSGGPVVLGLDGAYVRDRHPRPGRTFEVVVGQVRGSGDAPTRFAFVREGSTAGAATIAQALREHGVMPGTGLTVLSDGDAGLRAIQRAAAPEADPILDWFHIAMRWQHVRQLATGAIQQGQSAEARTWLLDRIERAKWALWNGQLLKTLGRLSELRVWTWNARADPSWLAHLRTHLSELTAYLQANADALPNYGARYRAGQAISTAFAESAVNQIIATRMIKRQQMRWNRDTVPPFLSVRVAVLNGTLEQTFRSWHAGFRPLDGPAASCAA